MANLIDEVDNTVKTNNVNFERVLVLQGGGSLGAYECGVFKYLYKHKLEFDILAGSSIGAVNTSIITSAQNGGENVAKVLEEFWLTISENVSPYKALITPLLSSDKTTAIWSSMNSILYGIPKAFLPKWFMPNSANYYFPFDWTYLYDPSPLKKTLKDFINFENLKKDQNNAKKDGKKRARLIITATDIQKGEPVVFDTAYQDITVDQIIASIGYPFYGIRWSVANERYLWDGSLLTNTPLMEVFKASPIKNKKLFIVDVFPRKQKEIPQNMLEVWHRARDIIFMDKTDKNIEMLKINERSLNLLKKVYEILNSEEAKVDETTREKIKKLDHEYFELTHKYGAAVTDVIRVGREEKDSHYMLEDADFSRYRIKKLISKGEKDAELVITRGINHD
jgi:NTE family protein